MKKPPDGYTQLAGSDRAPLANARPIGPVNTDERGEVTIYLRDPSTSNLSEMLWDRIQQKRPHLTRAEFSATHSASTEDITKVEQFAQAHGLSIVSIDNARRRIVLSGTFGMLSEAFGTELQLYEHAEGTYRGRTGPLHVPQALAECITGVFGLDNRPQAQPHIQRFDAQHAVAGEHTQTISYTPRQLAKIYDFPTTKTGTGQCIALIELAGGYKEQDLQTCLLETGIPLPEITSISVNGAQNAPTGDPEGPDGEVDLDIEVAGSIAPGAHIAVYFAANTDQGFLDAITQATHDATNNPSVISISWGAAEARWTQQAMLAMDQAFQAAAALGITVCCAAGDGGASDGMDDGRMHVDFPASSPFVLACGGTRLESTNDTISKEVVWNDNSMTSATGGGVSEVFGLPAWQSNVHVPQSSRAKQAGRGVPDIAADADPQTGYRIFVDGQTLIFGGTSAVAPLWSGLIALMNQQLGKSVGYLNPLLYQHYARLAKIRALHDVTSGNNGGYAARRGWDACTGLGTPDGTKLLDALTTL